jgi:hypothetical protein
MSCAHEFDTTLLSLFFDMLADLVFTGATRFNTGTALVLGEFIEILKKSFLTTVKLLIANEGGRRNFVKQACRHSGMKIADSPFQLQQNILWWQGDF